MAISVQFNGATIFKPGSYSKTTVDVGGGFPIGPAGLVAVIGEADAGAPGSAEVDIRDNRFTADQLPQIRDKYKSGAIVDAASFLFAPAADAAIPSGAQTVWFYKTNASTKASKALATTFGTATSVEYGIGGNRATIEIVNTAEVAPTVTGTAITANLGAGLDNKVITFTSNGGATVTVTMSATPGDHDTASKVATLIDTAIGAFGSCTVAATDKLVVTMDADATAHQKGFAKALEIGGANVALFGLSAAVLRSGTEAASTITLGQPRDLLTESDTVGGNAVLALGCTETGATVTVNATSVICTAAATVTFLKANYPTLKELAADIDILPTWTASVTNSQYNQLSVDVLDQVTAIGAFSPAGQPCLIKKDAAEVQAMFDASVVMSLETPGVKGLPDALVKVALTGGAKGATTPVDIVNALEKFTKFHVNFVLPLFSRDASADISDSLTDSGSTYTIDGIHQAVKTHISLMKSVKKRSERQSVLALKKSFVDCKTKAGDLADGRLQLVIQDVRQIDSTGAIKWFQPHALACLIVGSRSGAPIGEPMTFKFMNASGIRHTAQAMSTAEANIVQDFDPDTMADEAIEAGITFLEARQTGGFRVVVDNTTYGRDANFVWNRANVIYAADIVAYNFRRGLEDVYVGRKNTVSPAEVGGTAASILDQFRAQGITVSTPDAPAGYKSLTVRIEGNTIYVSVTIKIVEGIDFCLSDITIQRAQQ